MLFNAKKCFKLFSATLLVIGIQSALAEQTQIKEGDVKQCKELGLSSCPQPFDEKIPDPAKMLTWDQQERTIGFRNTYRMYEGDVFSPADKISPIPKAAYPMPAIQYSVDGKTYNLDDYLKRESVKGLLILKNGKIVYEYYSGGNTDTTLWTSRSVAKSIVTVLMGIAVKEGRIQSVDDPIVKYLPELKGSEWETVTVHQLMQHTSGIIWNENYADPNSDFAHMTLCEASKDPYNCVFELVKSRPSRAKPGEIWSYNTGGAWLVGVLLERVTGTTIADYLETRLWKRYPMEHQGIWQALVKDKISMGGHGFNATLRDWGRVGLFVAENGKLPSGEQLLPEDWIKKSTTWTQAKNSADAANPNGQYGYQWWFSGISPQANYEPKTTTTSDQTFWAQGIYGQAIGINPAENLVMVQWSTWKNADSDIGLYYEQSAFFNAVSNALKDK